MIDDSRAPIVSEIVSDPQTVKTTVIMFVLLFCAILFLELEENKSSNLFKSKFY
jgi:hypothetical protein